MKIYAEAVKNGQIDRKLSPILQRLKQENIELHQKATDLEKKLEKFEQKEKENLKVLHLSPLSVFFFEIFSLAVIFNFRASFGAPRLQLRVN